MICDPIKERLPHGNIAAVDNNRPQVCVCVLPVPEMCRDSAGCGGRAGRQQGVLLACAPLIAVGRGRARRGAGPALDQLSQHGVRVCAEAHLPQSSLCLRRGVTQFPEKVHSELELFAVWFEQVRSWALAEKCLIHPGASGPLLSSTEDVLHSLGVIFID